MAQNLIDDFLKISTLAVKGTFHRKDSWLKKGVGV